MRIISEDGMRDVPYDNNEVYISKPIPFDDNRNPEYNVFCGDSLIATFNDLTEAKRLIVLIADKYENGVEVVDLGK